MHFLITGTAGFIGFHVACRLLAEGHTILGIDGFTSYYDVSLKRRRHAILTEFPNFTGRDLMLEDSSSLSDCVAEAAPQVVIHLAAQAGVRYSTDNPKAYIDSNVIGTFNLLQALRQQPCSHLVVASTSSVYGANTKQPFNERHPTNQPLSLYAATKISVEMLVSQHAYHFQLPTTVVRPFTVFGPWGRPDMAIFKFTKSIIEGRAIDVYGFGKIERDFTYIDDVVESICRLIESPPALTGADCITPDAFSRPYRVVNIGYGQPVRLDQFVATIEKELGKKAIRRDMPLQIGDVPSTWADIALLEQITGYRPVVPIARGIQEFVTWYRRYYGQE
jgi:UDP-glucuronate 4-epimerase